VVYSSNNAIAANTAEHSMNNLAQRTHYSNRVVQTRVRKLRTGARLFIEALTQVH